MCALALAFAAGARQKMQALACLEARSLPPTAIAGCPARSPEPRTLKSTPKSLEQLIALGGLLEGASSPSKQSRHGAHPKAPEIPPSIARCSRPVPASDPGGRLPAGALNPEPQALPPTSRTRSVLLRPAQRLHALAQGQKQGLGFRV